MTINPNNCLPPPPPPWLDASDQIQIRIFEVRHLILFFRKTSEKEFLELVFTAKKRCTVVTICKFLTKPCRGAISEFTQQDGREKRTAKRLCVTNVTELLLACYVVILN